MHYILTRNVIQIVDKDLFSAGFGARFKKVEQNLLATQSVLWRFLSKHLLSRDPPFRKFILLNAPNSPDNFG